LSFIILETAEPRPGRRLKKKEENIINKKKLKTGEPRPGRVSQPWKKTMKMKEHKRSKKLKQVNPDLADD